MVSKVEIENRRLKIKQLIGQGLRPNEIQNHLDITERTFCRDMHQIRKEIKESPEQDFAINRIIELRDGLLRKTLLRVNSSRSPEGQIRAIQTANNILSDLRRDYEQVGLFPSPKYGVTVQQMHPLTELKMQALESLRRKKEREDNSKKQHL